MTDECRVEALPVRWRVRVQGLVQGVGYRPFVYRLATGLGLTGWVGNTPDGVTIEAEGQPEVLQSLVDALRVQAPANARVEEVHAEAVSRSSVFQAFQIRQSQEEGAASTRLPADLAPCRQCSEELHDPINRRYRYPFINCTDCGPRYSLIEGLPYDRARTAMRHFQMCPRCLAEYHDPASRRFHAEPNACPDCGPRMVFCRADGTVLAKDEAALSEAVSRLAAGDIIALKGQGGFQLLVDARNTRAVHTLRERKHRPRKPLAVMFDSLASVRQRCAVSMPESQLLIGPERPIVLLRAQHGLAANLAPGRAELGVMLPCTPLHELLLDDLGFPVVATSGNLSGEPIAIDNQEALARLGGIADGFLMHDRPIVRPLDDSVARVVAGRGQLLRRARGFSPNLSLPLTLPPGWGATGGHLKTTVALSTGHGAAVLSQHLGDMDNALGREGFARTVDDLQRLFASVPRRWAHDGHPDYYTTHFARDRCDAPCAVQHHVAHIAAVMAEHGITEPVLGVAWDGSGLGDDKTLWGGEFLRLDSRGYERVAHLRPFRLPGGEAAMKEPRRSAFGLLHALMAEQANEWENLAPLNSFTKAERKLLMQALKAGLNAPETSSVGRLFDAVAALSGVCLRASYEGQAAAELEAVLGRTDTTSPYRFELPGPEAARPWQVDWAPAIFALLDDMERGEPVSGISAAFHQGLVNAIVAVAKQTKLSRVVLAGGCFQNACLLESTITALEGAGFQVFWPCRQPPNDGGLALGQLAWATGALQGREGPCVWPCQDA